MTEKQSYNNELEKGRRRRRRKRRKWLMLWSLMLRMMLPHTHTSEREAATKIRELFFLILPKSIHQHMIGTSLKHLEENVSFSTIWKSLLKLLSWASNILWEKNRFHNECFSSGGNEDDEPDKMAIAFGRFGTFKRFLVRSSITMPSPSQILLSGFNNKLF